jgi:hypothetical protein
MPRLYNIRLHGYVTGAVLIDRTTEWGNEFRITHYCSREDAVALHRQRVERNKLLCEKIKAELGGKDLLCWCWPKLCHGNTYLEIANGSNICPA